MNERSAKTRLTRVGQWLALVAILSVVDISAAAASPAAMLSGASGNGVLTALILLALSTGLVWFYYDEKRRLRMEALMAELDADKAAAQQASQSTTVSGATATPLVAPAMSAVIAAADADDDSDFGILSTQEFDAMITEEEDDADQDAAHVAAPPPLPVARSARPTMAPPMRSLPRLTEKLGRMPPGPLDRLLSRPMITPPDGLDEDTIVDPKPRAVPRRRLASGTGPQVTPPRQPKSAPGRRANAARATCTTPRRTAPRAMPKPLPPPPAKRPIRTPGPAARLRAKA